jgi:hypothetical protein
MSIKFGTSKAQMPKNKIKSFFKWENPSSNFIFNFRFEHKIKKCHSFDSYKGHRLFESRLKKAKNPVDDKFYDPNGDAKEMQIYQRWKTQNHLDISKSPDRPNLP